MKQHTHAKATGRFVKKPKSMLAKPARAAVAVMRSCFTTVKDVVSFFASGVVYFGDGVKFLPPAQANHSFSFPQVPPIPSGF